MRLQQTQTLQQAYTNLQHLPKVEQKQVFNLIDSLLLKTKTQQPTDEPSELQKRFLEWRKNYEASIADLDDGWTDEDHDALWNSVRDKNDTGREVNFDE